MDFSAPINAFVAGFPDFIIQLGVALGLFITSLIIYVIMTPHKELDLIPGRQSLGLAPLWRRCGRSCHSFGLLPGALVRRVGSADLGRGHAADPIACVPLRRHVPSRPAARRIAEGDVAAAVLLMA